MGVGQWMMLFSGLICVVAFLLMDANPGADSKSDRALAWACVACVMVVEFLLGLALSLFGI